MPYWNSTTVEFQIPKHFQWKWQHAQKWGISFTSTLEKLHTLRILSFIPCTLSFASKSALTHTSLQQLPSCIFPSILKLPIHRNWKYTKDLHSSTIPAQSEVFLSYLLNVYLLFCSRSLSLLNQNYFLTTGILPITTKQDTNIATKSNDIKVWTRGSLCKHPIKFQQSCVSMVTRLGNGPTIQWASSLARHIRKPQQQTRLSKDHQLKYNYRNLSYQLVTPSEKKSCMTFFWRYRCTWGRVVIKRHLPSECGLFSLQGNLFKLPLVLLAFSLVPTESLEQAILLT